MNAYLHTEVVENIHEMFFAPLKDTVMNTDLCNL